MVVPEPGSQRVGSGHRLPVRILLLAATDDLDRTIEPFHAPFVLHGTGDRRRDALHFCQDRRRRRLIVTAAGCSANDQPVDVSAIDIEFGKNEIVIGKTFHCFKNIRVNEGFVARKDSRHRRPPSRAPPALRRVIELCSGVMITRSYKLGNRSRSSCNCVAQLSSADRSISRI